MEKVLGQLWYGIAGFCAGILVRFFYDVIHGLWRKRTRTACFIRDWCFWLAAGVFVFRNPDDKEKDKVAQPAYFPNKCVGIAGGAGGFDTNVDCQDTAINGDGSYTISIAQSGTVNAEAQKFDDGSTNEGWIWAANAFPVAPATSGTDSNSKKDDSKTDSKSDSKTDSKANSTAATTSSKAGTTGTATATSSSAASDNTAATGATAGIALAGIALAGAAIVVSKRK